MSVATADPGTAAGPSGASPPAGERDDRLDLLRGLFVFQMIVGHLGWTRYEAHFPIGWATAAEGFFCVSGATLGLVARRFEATGRRARLLRRLRLRALWLLALNTALVAVAIAFEVAPAFSQRALDRRFAGQPGWLRFLSFDHALGLDVLPRYAVLVAAAPAVLWLLRRPRGAIVAGGLSVALWGANFVTQKALLLPGVEMSRTAFAVASWQLVFFGGLILAWSFPPRVVRPGEDGRRRTALLAIATVLAIGFMVWAGATPGNANAARGPLASWVERGTVAPLRLLNVVVAGLFLWLAVDRWRIPLVRWLGPLLLPLGRNALAAFVLHLPLLWLSSSVRGFGEGNGLRLAAAVAAAVAISLVVRWRGIRRILMPV